jgi:hypothetical protein
MGRRLLLSALVATLALAACSTSDGSDSGTVSAASTDVTTTDIIAETTPDDTTVDIVSDTTTDGDNNDEPDAESEPGAASSESDGSSTTFEVDVWADNWMAVYINGELIGEDSVPITTERSFNAETFTFEASVPFTVAIEAKDFKETDSGIEYIGEQNQQMGDGGIIAQVTNITTGEVVAATDATWNSLVVHQAPLNKDCEKDADPDATCEVAIIDTPADWAASNFDDSAWTTATEWTAADVGPKDGYDEITWDGSAQLIWGTDLETDNTVLLRTTIGA